MVTGGQSNGSYTGVTIHHAGVDTKQSRRRKLLGFNNSGRDCYIGAECHSDNNSNNGRVHHHHQHHHESSPLEMDSRLLSHRKSHDYATFDRKIIYYKPKDSNESFLFSTAATTWQRSLFSTLSGRWWWWMCLALLATSLVWYRHQQREQGLTDDAFFFSHSEDMGGTWEWDHNVYVPRKGDDGHSKSLHHANSAGGVGGDFIEEPSLLIEPQEQAMLIPRRNVLVAQIAASPALAVLSGISSRPNRAYARQWKMNFVHIGGSSGRSSGGSAGLARECLDRVHVLHFVVEKQEQEKDEPTPAWPLPPRLVYDAMVLLPPDAIITDLDMDLLQLLPNDDQLVSIAGWPDFGGSTDILMFNLRHVDMPTVARKWLESVQPNDVTCGNHNDIRLLVAAMESTMLSSSSSTSTTTSTTSAEAFIRSLSESKQGFVENNAIKCIPFSVPESRAQRLLTNAGETKALLQATADAVCYRYYPKCEVF